MANINRNYKINFAAETITISKAFEKRINQGETDAYKTFCELLKDFPHLTVVNKPTPQRTAKKRITYSSMRSFISVLPDATKYLQQLEQVREMSKAQKSPYHFVKRWFVNTFPAYDAIPTFDAKGNPIIQINEAAGQKVMEEMEAAA